MALAKGLFVLLLLGFFSSYIIAKPTTARIYKLDPGKRTLFALFGDSITSYSTSLRHEGWALNLDAVYERRIDILNRGHPGYNSRWARMLFPKYFSQLPLDDRKIVLFLFLGANDATTEEHRIHVPLDEYKDNLRYLINLMQKPEGGTLVPGTRTIIVISPPPVDEVLFRMCPQNEKVMFSRNTPNTERYANASMRVAQQENGFNGVPVYSIDLFHHILNSPGSLSNYLHDGLHLSSSGNRVLSDKILEILEIIPGLKKTEAKFDYPPFKMIDHENPAKTFKISH